MSEAILAASLMQKYDRAVILTECQGLHYEPNDGNGSGNMN